MYARNESGVVEMTVYDNPEIDFFVSKPDKWVDDGLRLLSRPLDELEPYVCRYRDVLHHVAHLTGRQTELELMGRYGKSIHFTNNVCGSDFDIEDVYIDKFLQLNDPAHCANLSLRLAYFDIEVDTINHVGFPHESEAPCAVNAITYYQDWTDTLFVLLSTADNPSLDTYLGDEHRQLAIANELADGFSAIRNRPVAVVVRKYTSEYELIIAFVQLILGDSPDIIGAWNARFDIITLENRMRRIGIDPAYLFAHPDLPKWWWHKLDETSQKNEERIDIYNTPTPYTFIDMLTAYAQVRKGFKLDDSYTLDYIAGKWLGIHKEDLSAYGDNVNINTVAHYAPNGFVKYSALDTMLLSMLNERTRDIDFIYQLSLITRTRFNAVYFKTIMLRNFVARVVFRDKFQRAICNNFNALNEAGKNKRKFRGGFVADPNKNLPYGVEFGGGVLSDMIFDHVVDMDFSSMYPSIMRAYNISAETLVGYVLGTDNNETALDTRIMEIITARDHVEYMRAYGHVNPDEHLTRLVNYGLGVYRLDAR
jgi:DNA polymerase elongation subunit (family B)